jgi:hypothetical protein
MQGFFQKEYVGAIILQDHDRQALLATHAIEGL